MQTLSTFEKRAPDCQRLGGFKFIFLSFKPYNVIISQHSMRRRLNVHVTSWFSGVNGCDSLISITFLCCYHTHTHTGIFSVLLCGNVADDEACVCKTGQTYSKLSIRDKTDSEYDCSCIAKQFTSGVRQVKNAMFALFSCNSFVRYGISYSLLFLIYV